LSLYLIPGILAGAIVAYYWYYQQYNAQILIILGFIMMVIYHVIMYNSFGNNFTIQGFWLPSVIKGFGTAVLYIAVGLYITGKHKLEAVLTVSGIAILARSFIGSGTFSSMFTYYLYAQRIRHLSYLGGLSDGNNYLLKEPGSAAELYRDLQQQATLTASKELSGYIIIAGLLIIVGLLIKYSYHKIKDITIVT
jgi:hypothetical protein